MSEAVGLVALQAMTGMRAAGGIPGFVPRVVEFMGTSGVMDLWMIVVWTRVFS